MNNYEAMFIVRPDLSEEERKTLFQQIGDGVTKLNGTITSAAVWSEKRKLYFPLKKYTDGVYYLLHFSLPPRSVDALHHGYKLNEGILRVMVSSVS